MLQFELYPTNMCISCAECNEDNKDFDRLYEQFLSIATKLGISKSDQVVLSGLDEIQEIASKHGLIVNFKTNPQAKKQIVVDKILINTDVRRQSKMGNALERRKIMMEEKEPKEETIEDILKNDVLPKCKDFKFGLTPSEWKIILKEKELEICLDAYREGTNIRLNKPKAYIRFFAIHKDDNIINIEWETKMGRKNQPDLVKYNNNERDDKFEQKIEMNLNEFKNDLLDK